MSFPRYPKYKDSGYIWGGAVPEHWTPTRLRFLLREGYEGLKIGPFGSQLKSDMLEDEGGFKVYGQENIIARDFTRGRRFIGDAKFEELSVYEITPGDLLITMMGTSGRCGVAPSNMAQGIMDSHLLRMRVTSTIRPEFVRILIDEAAYVATQIQLSGKGSIMHGLNSAIVKNLLMFVPSIEEQDKILAFLDRETAKIDELVAEQRRLMELLKEKRQAVISAAVTGRFLMVKSELRMVNEKLTLHDLDTPVMAQPNNQGDYQTPEGRPTILHNNRIALPHPDLDSSRFKTLKSKSSGIEWLGDVPEHWGLTPLKYLGEIISGFAFKSEEFTDSGIRVLKIANIQTFTLDWSDESFLPEHFYDEHQKFAVLDGDVVFALTRPIISTGLKAAIATIGDERVLINQRNAIFRPSELLNKRFFYHALFAEFFRVDFENRIDFTGQQPNISPIDIQDISIPFPSLEEQEQIAVKLDSITSKFDTLTAEAQRAIDLLQERRTALISAAVTGQIDVRGTDNHKEAM